MFFNVFIAGRQEPANVSPFLLEKWLGDKWWTLWRTSAILFCYEIWCNDVVEVENRQSFVCYDKVLMTWGWIRGRRHREWWSFVESTSFNDSKSSEIVLETFLLLSFCCCLEKSGDWSLRDFFKKLNLPQFGCNKAASSGHQKSA